MTKKILFVAFFMLAMGCGPKPKNQESTPLTDDAKAAAALKKGDLVEFKKLLTLIMKKPTFPKSTAGSPGDEALAWAILQKDIGTLKAFLNSKTIQDFHRFSVVGTSTDNKDIYGYPIYLLLKDLNELGNKALIKAFFTFKPDDSSVNYPRDRLTGGSFQLEKLWLSETTECPDDIVPADLKEAQKIASMIDKLPINDDDATFANKLDAILNNP